VVGDVKIVDVTFTNGDRMRAKVTAVDPYIDLAVLRILETKNNSLNQNVLRPLPLGNSSGLSVGDQVIAIGNPYGLAGSMTTGIVSQMARLVPAPNVPYSVPDVIQTDAVSFLEGNTRPGEKVVLKVIRNGTALELDAVMGERPPPSMLPNNN
jgi:S1-C subfamily serine protease